MKKIIIYMLVILAVGSTANITIAKDTKISLPEKSFQIASTTFLPEIEDSEFGIGGKKFENDQSFNKGDKNCSDYSFNKNNCTRNRSLYNACGFDPSKFKTCVCNTTKYDINQSNCSYTGSLHSYPEFLGNNRCTNDGQQPISTECKCLEKFTYTTNSSCGDSKKVIDTSSYCTQSGQVRYEGCKCDPERFPHTYTGGNSYSKGFKAAVKAKCGNEDNFYSCNQNSTTVNFACAIADTTYKYTTTSCKAESSDWETQGNSQWFYNGNGDFISLYITCDCPNDYKVENNCPDLMNRRTWDSTPSPSCFIVGHGLRDGTERQYGKTCAEILPNVGGRLNSQKSCIKRDNSKVYSSRIADCRCYIPDAHYQRFNNDTCWSDWTKSSQWCVTCRNADGLFVSYRTSGKND